MGSPPHTRGILLPVLIDVSTPRFTPAYAGNTNALDALRDTYQVHPRIRGEYQENTPFHPLRHGSPPHTRGIHAHKTRKLFDVGFTPAYAGNTVPQEINGEKHGVHPRIRGEYRNITSRTSYIVGSPPHTRGIPLPRPKSAEFPRFTPAYAGNTHNHYIIGACIWVHPRIRGEYVSDPRLVDEGSGSPPHTRGIQPLIQDFDRVLGFTPAYAGNTAVY